MLLSLLNAANGTFTYTIDKCAHVRETKRSLGLGHKRKNGHFELRNLAETMPNKKEEEEDCLL